MLDAEVLHAERRSRGSLSTSDASAVVAFVASALVFGAFAPRLSVQNDPWTNALVASSSLAMAKRNSCQIECVGKRRDGGSRYWCMAHRADATAKYGRPAEVCRYAHVPSVTEAQTCRLDVRDYAGGLALWGAVPPVYDTTRLPLDRGVHVHARTKPGKTKDIDATYRSVVLSGLSDQAAPITVSELDAIYYMVTSVFGFAMRHVECTFCGVPHLDKDWFSVHAHKRHLCAGCGRTFRDTEIAIGNPISGLRRSPVTRPAKKVRRLRQRDFPGGLQVWGSNPALVWTSRKEEEDGVHLHGYEESDKPSIDDTFSAIEIDGITLDPTLVRTLMAQRALPHISDRVHHFGCPSCGAAHNDSGELAFTPHQGHVCDLCGTRFKSQTRLRNVIGNPMLGIIDELSRHAPRHPQHHDLALIPETL